MQYKNDFLKSRQQFRQRAEENDYTLQTNHHPTLRASDGLPLTIDTAIRFPTDARTGMVTVSGTHGIEGIFGSNVQRQWLEKNVLNSNIAELHIHLVNPWGVINNRRVNEDNVDVNRNFINFNENLPTNKEYLAHRSDLEFDNWPGDTPESVDLPLFAWIEKDGYEAVQTCITKGQYHCNDGLFFGGASPCWSRKVVERLAQTYLTRLDRVVLVDFHTGLGDWGTNQLIVESSNGSSLVKSLRNHVNAGVTSSVSASLHGTLSGNIGQNCGISDYLGIVAEFGTLQPLDVLRALRADHWFYSQKITDPENQTRNF